LPSGRPLATVPLGHGPLLAVRLLGGGSRLIVVTARGVESDDAHTMAPLASMPIRPVPLLPTSAAISPDGATVVVGSQDGAITFVATATGQSRRAPGGHS